MEGNAILADDSVFDDIFVPHTLVGRESHVKEIARSLGPAKSDRRITNLFIHGPPGVGKTLVCKSILKEHFPMHAVYVNCWHKRTMHKVVHDILQKSGVFLSGKESTAELLKRFAAADKKRIICLDESDHLRDKDVLYDLVQHSYGVVLISNDSHSLRDLDERIRSRVLFNEIEFKPYSKEEIISIFNERVFHGLRPSAMDPSLTPIVAGMCNGDARLGLQMIRMAAKQAEGKGLSKITIEEIKNASRSVRKYAIPYLLSKLNDHQKAIYEILKKNCSMDSGRLYTEYCKAVKDPVVDRAYRNHMERMEDLGLVKSEGSGRWKRYAVAT